MSLPDDERDESPTVLRHYPGEQILHRFTLERELAGGGMGVVWLARDEELSRRIALKFLPDRVRNDLAAIQHLKSEAIKSIELAHPHIVRIYDFLYDRQNAAISMEFVDGETLSSLRKARPSRVFEAYDLRTRVRQLCSALEYAHEVAEIVHRDLKPANLMVNRRDQLKVTDFGIASSLQIGKGKQEAAGGTPGYMSPQQAARHAPSVLDDVYSLGATIYDLLTGRTPFYDEERKQTVAHLPDSRLVPMQERRNLLRIGGEPIPRQWEEAVAKCLEYNPAHRPQSVREVADLLGLLETTTTRTHYQPPEAPTGLKARSTDKRVALTWNASAGALTYQVKRALKPGGPYTVVGTVNDATEYDDTTVENGTTYFYTVEAANNVSASPLSGEVKGEPQAPPAPPVNLRARVTDCTVLLEWDAAAGAIRYIIKRGVIPEEGYTVIATVTTGTRFQDAGVENGVLYRYVVESVNSVGLTTPSEEFQVSPCPLPRAPLDLTVTTGDRSLRLKWRAVSGAAAYRVLRSETTGGPFYVIKTLDSAEGKTSYEDREVENGETHYYVIEALNAAGASPHSNEVKGQSQAPPGTPMNLRAKLADRAVLLEWDAAKGAVSYHIKRADSPGEPFKVIATVTTGTRFQDGGVENDILYRYVVEALNSAGLATSSAEFRATPCPVPKAPLGLAATAGDRGVRLTWRKVPEAVAYRILRSESSGGPYQTLATLEEKTHFDDERVQNGRAYYYVIEALNAAGISPQSHEVWGVPMPVPQRPMGIRVEEQDGQVLISWAASSNANGYTIQRSAGAGGPYTQVATVTTGTSYLDPDLENGSTYHYVLTAFNGSGVSESSAEVTACPHPIEVVPPAPAWRISYGAIAALLVLSLLVAGGWFGFKKFTMQQGLEIVSEPRGAQVFINERAVGTTPLKAPLSAEVHSVRLVLEGYDPHEQKVQVRTNDVQKLSALLFRSKGILAITPKPAGRYDFKVRNEKGDLLKAGTTEASGASFELETGRYTVEMDNPGWPPRVETLTVERGATALLEPDFVPAAMAFTSDPTEAEVIIAGRSFGKTPLTKVMLPPGQIKIRARYPGLPDKEEEVIVKRGVENQHQFRFDYGHVAILSTPPGASVVSQKSGALLGKTPYLSKEPVAEGKLDVTLQLNGYDRVNLPINVLRGQTATQTFNLVKITTPKGVLFVEADPKDATVLLNNERFGLAATRIEGITPGRHRLHLERDGYETTEPVEVVITANETATPPRITMRRSTGILQIAAAGPSVRYLVRENSGKVVSQGVGSTNVPLPTGEYKVELERSFWEQKRNESKDVAIARGSTVKLEPSISAGQVEVRVDPPGAEILWAGQVRSTNSKAVLELPSGLNVLTARHPLLGEKPVEVKTEAGKMITAEIRFEYGSAQISTRPEGAEVFLADTTGNVRKVGMTPYQAEVLRPGPVSYVVRKSGYRPQTMQGRIEAKGKRALNLEAVLEPMVGSLMVVSSPAGAQATLGTTRQAAGEPFKDLAVGVHAVTVTLPDHEAWQTNVTIEDNQQTDLAVNLVRSTGGLYLSSQPPGASYVLTYLADPKLRVEGRTPQIRTGLPVGSYRVDMEKGIWKLNPANVLVERKKTNAYESALPYGYLSVSTEPKMDAALEINGTALGALKAAGLEVAAGRVSLLLKATGYKPYLTNFQLGAQQNLKFTARLDPAYGPQPGQRWTNSLGLIFVPLGRHHVCVTETRVMDFVTYEKETGSRGGDAWKSPQFTQTPSDPVVNVNYDDAKTFAQWLTARERRFTNRFRLEEQTYRLPTEAEWSQAAAPGNGLFIWGMDWPPPSNAGNFYELLTFDGFEFTAPVATFNPNALGIYDLAGNVWEWCEVAGTTPVLRGGSWLDGSSAILKIDYRQGSPAKERRRDTGFRLILDSGKPDLQAAN